MDLKKILKKYGVKTAYVFGSQASGKTHKHSDFDIAVRYGKNLSLKKTLSLANELSGILKKEVDLLDLDKASLQFKFRVYKNRKIIFADDPKKEVLTVARDLSLYHDNKFYFDRYVKMEMKRILIKEFA